MGFAVVIPAFNHRESVVASTTSALTLAGVEEVIVVDDGSTDDTAATVAGIADRRVRLLRQDNGGPSAARNAGALSSSASHLIFLDVEDELLPDSIDVFGSHHTRGAGVVRTGAVRVDGDGSVSRFMAEPSDRPYPRGAPLPGTFSIDRELFESIGGYDEELRYGENSELLLRAQSALLSSGGSIAVSKRPTVRVVVNVTHDTSYYRERRLASIERMLVIHREEFERDRATWHNHHAMASVLYRQDGSPQPARQHGWAALRLRPWSVRSWGRLVQAMTSSSG